MKKLKFLFSVLICLAFVAGTTYAQDNNNGKWQGEYTLYPTDFHCIGETVTGEIHGEFTMFKSGKIQEKWDGCLIGDDTGDVYSVKMVKNHIWKEWINGTAWTNNQVWFIMVKNETQNQKVGLIHLKMHQSNTGNTSWPLHLDFTIERYECL